MARRKGNKKTPLRDKARDSTTFRRVVKVGATTAALVAGGSYFLRSNSFKKFVDEGYMKALSKTKKEIKNEFLNKPKNLRTLKTAYDKHIGKEGSEFKKVLEKQKNKSSKKINASNSSLVKKLHSINQSKDQLLRNAISKEEPGKLQKEFIEKQLEKLPDLSKKQEKELKDFIKNTYHIATEENVKNKSIESHIQKHLKNYSLNKDFLREVANDIVKFKEQNPIDKDAVIEKYEKAAEQITTFRMNNLKSKNQRTFADALNEVFNQVVSNRLTGTRAATIGDIQRLEKFDEIDFGLKRLKHVVKEEGEKSLVETINYNDEIKKLLLNDDYKDVVIDASLRVARDKDGNEVLQDFSESFEFLNNMKEKFAETLPGKILLKGFDLNSNKETFGILNSNLKDLNAHLTGSEDNVLESMMVYADGVLFGTREINNKVEIDFANRQDSRVVTGWRKKITHDMLGSDKLPGEAFQSEFAQFFDLNQDGKFNAKEEIKRWLNKSDDPNWERNSLKRTREYFAGEETYHTRFNNVLAEVMAEKPELTEIEARALARGRLYNSSYLTSVIMNKQITGVSDSLMDLIIERGNLNDKEVRLMELLKSGTNDDITQFFFDILDNGAGGVIDTKEFKNYRLKDIIDLSLRNEEQAKNVSHISLKEGNPIPIFDMAIDEKYQRDVVGQLRVEMVKEILLNKDEEYREFNPSNNFMNWISTLGLDGNKSNELENIGLLGMFEDFNNLKEGKYSKELEKTFQEGGKEERLHNIIQNDYRLKKLFNEKMLGMEESFNILNRGYTGGINETDLYDEYNKLTVVKQSKFSGLNIIENINKAIKGDFYGVLGDVIDGAKELAGGRRNPDDVTNLTLSLQYSISRINYGLQDAGLHLSSASMGSPLETYLSFATKRVLPIMAAGKVFEYLNDESRRFLGSSITEAGARGLSYMDIGARKVAYGTGIGHFINSWAESSVIHEYYFGSNHFNTAEEQEEWYEDGYTPVRKGRFWSFGSASEFRGGSVAYWQPNYLRRAESNYHDISVYGSSEEKWAHSWIPTPTHPLSTIRAALNPYWLEKKHLKDNDRPYPLTAKMFSEGTPWGAVLNPTVGELLKPVRMLPEARIRLGGRGRDGKAIIERINQKIKSRERENDDLIIVNGSDIRNAEYVPYGNPEVSELNISFRDGRLSADGVGYMDTIRDISNYEPPTGEDYVEGYGNGTQTIKGAGGKGLGSTTGSFLTIKQQKELNRFEEGLVNHDDVDYGIKTISQAIVGAINSYIKYKRNRYSLGGGGQRNLLDLNNAPSKDVSTYVYTNKINNYNTYTREYYAERLDPKLINTSLRTEYLKDITYSTKQISGMYGFLTGLITDDANSFTFRYENAGQMASFTRRFWDANIGGLGGGTMEIARRFFPSENKQRININPLLNNMPDWIPESYHTGDPYTNIPKGEMRLPGKGYEAINKLHPDRFGDYGAYDRYKILADIAPNSTEYKKWKNIAENTVTDPELLKDMKKIAERAAKMSGNHEFFEYTFLRNNTPYRKGIVKNIQNGVITLADNTNLSLAGLNITKNTDEGLYEMLSSGANIVYRTNKNKVLDKDEYGNIKPERTYSAVIYKPGEATSINKELLDRGYAEDNVEDKSVLGKLGKLSPMQESSGAFQEFIAHAPIPLVHNKLLKVESAYESYMNETYYGTSFQTWDHPYKAFVKPLINKQSGKSILNEMISLGIAYNHFTNVLPNSAKNKGYKWLSNIALSTMNPTAFLGGNVAFAMHLSNGAIGKGQELTRWQKGAKIGAILGTAKYAWDNADNPIKSMATMAIGGFALGRSDFGWEVTEKILGKMTGEKGALIGAGIGLAMSALKNPRFDKQKMFGKWTPKETRKKWDLDEYFDRLEYVKYMGLYKEAARKASFFEHTDIKGIFKELDKNKKKLAKLNVKQMKYMEKQQNGHDKYAAKIEDIEEEKKSLEEQSKIFYKGGKYTEAAIAYKKKAESTMFGISGASTKDELLASIPVQYKDHFQAFFEITDKKERKKILKSVSPLMRRPLQAAWGMKVDKPKSNLSYFHVHAMPNVGWRGWKPNQNLKYVKMKTIQNEGMLLSDFGYYNSEKAEAQYELAPDIKNYDKGTGLGYSVAMKRKLHGAGLKVSNVSVSETSAPGLWVVGDIKEDVSNAVGAAGYGVRKLTHGLLTSLF